MNASVPDRNLALELIRVTEAAALAAALAFTLSSGTALAKAKITIDKSGDGPTEGFNDPTPVRPVGCNFGTTLGQQRLISFQAAADIWAKADQFHYLWREMSGNFSVSATTKFLTDGNPHRKASIMLRKTVDTDSPFLHLAIHGDGMPSMQFRSAKADTVNTLDFPIEGPGVFTLKLVREGTTVTVSVAKEGGAMRELGHTLNTLGSPILVGLGVASHSVDALNTVLFSNVSVEPLPAPGVVR